MDTDLQAYRHEVRTLLQAAINPQLAQERLKILLALETLEACYQGSDRGILAIVILLVKSRAVAG